MLRERALCLAGRGSKGRYQKAKSVTDSQKRKQINTSSFLRGNPTRKEQNWRDLGWEEKSENAGIATKPSPKLANGQVVTKNNTDL